MESTFCIFTFCDSCWSSANSFSLLQKEDGRLLKVKLLPPKEDRHSAIVFSLLPKEDDEPLAVKLFPPKEDRYPAIVFFLLPKEDDEPLTVKLFPQKVNGHQLKGNLVLERVNGALQKNIVLVFGSAG